MLIYNRYETKCIRMTEIRFGFSGFSESKASRMGHDVAKNFEVQACT